MVHVIRQGGVKGATGHKLSREVMINLTTHATQEWDETPVAALVNLEVVALISGKAFLTTCEERHGLQSDDLDCNHVQFDAGVLIGTTNAFEKYAQIGIVGTDLIGQHLFHSPCRRYV